jgi:tetrahydromethanopterin S-methyltransferase subunit G
MSDTNERKIGLPQVDQVADGLLEAGDSSEITGEEDCLAILDRIEQEANDAVSANIGEKLSEISMINAELAEVQRRLSAMPKNLRVKGEAAIAPRLKQLGKRRTELLQNAGVKITYIYELIDDLQGVVTFGQLSKVTEEAVDLGLLTAERNAKGNISFHTVRYVDDRRPEVKKRLIELKKLVHFVSLELAKQAGQKRKPDNGNK